MTTSCAHACPRCGCLVVDDDAHQLWHDQLLAVARQLDAVASPNPRGW